MRLHSRCVFDEPDDTMTNFIRQGLVRRRAIVQQWLPMVAAAALAVASSVALGADGSAVEVDGPDQAAHRFGFEQVQAVAREMANGPFDDDAIHLEDWLQQFDYDAYREIEFRRERALWHDSERPFQVQFFHRGGIFPNPVQIHVIRDGQAEPFAFATDLFNYRALQIEGRVPEGLGFAGFKVLSPVNDPQRYDEVLSFLGSSYFRALGKGSAYGLSARGLAINASQFGHEEFPWFRAFWIDESASSDAELRIYALLDSQSLTGAYQFDLKPGDPTVLDVEAVLFTRKSVEELGVAPLTSMYLFGEIDPEPPVNDYRPEVHDSDGLLIHTAAGEYIWRPLHNPVETMLSRYPLDGSGGPRGFGLLQRDRDFDHYQDLEAHYQDRPSVWIEPQHGFDEGEVRLIEIASTSEAIDSIVAYWTPQFDEPIPAGHELRLGYRMLWGNSLAGCPTGGKVVATRTAASDGGVRYVIDFDGQVLDELPPSAAVTGVVEVVNGSSGPAVVQHNPVNGTWRLFFDVTSSSSQEPMHLRAYLKHGDDVVSETWSYRCRM